MEETRGQTVEKERAGNNRSDKSDQKAQKRHGDSIHEKKDE